MYVFVEDLRGEGPGAVVDRVLGYGCTGLTVAAAYHRARDVTPHGPARVTLRHDGLWFPPPPALFDGLRLTPPIRDEAGDGLLGDLRRRTADRGATLNGWAVFLHNTTLGLAHQDVTQENCFGDRGAPADLCPSHPDVRAYAVALARAVARQGVDSVVAESLHFGFFGHGYHHDRSFVRLGAVEEFLLGLCFCGSCRERADAAGADSAAARAAATRIVAAVLDGGTPLAAELSLETLDGCGVGDYVRARISTVTTLAASAADAVAAEGSRLVFLDITGALKGYADGRPSGALARDDAWRIGVDPAAVGAVAAEYAMLGYVRYPTRLNAEVAGYRAALGDGTPLRVTLRPGAPDTPSAADLATKLVAASDADAVDFYNYGMYPFPVLDRIGDTLKH
jgi:hypothetical protein